MENLVEGDRQLVHPSTGLLDEYAAEISADLDPSACVDDIIAACENSDVYDFRSLIEAGLPPEVSIRRAPEERILALVTALTEHQSTRVVPHHPHLLEVIRAHDAEQYRRYTTNAGTLAYIMREALGEHGVITHDDFSEWGTYYALLPEDQDEQQRFERIFGANPDVYIDRVGMLRVSPLDFQRGLTLAGRVSVTHLLDKVYGLPYDYQPPRPTTPEKPQEDALVQQFPENLAEEPKKVTKETPAKEDIAAEPSQPRIRPFDLLRTPEGKVPVPRPPKKRLWYAHERSGMLAAARAESFRLEVKAELEALYNELPVSSIITDAAIRRRLFDPKMHRSPAAKSVVRALLAEDSRFAAWDVNGKIFTVVKPEAPVGAQQYLERYLHVQQAVTTRALDSIEAQAREQRRHELNINGKEFLKLIQGLDAQADASLVFYIARADPRISSVSRSKLHFTVPAKFSSEVPEVQQPTQELSRVN